jgi:threonine/homoserine/homoserine lactone efflux protein
MINDILAAIPWGIFLAFTIGPVFFILIETSITKGFRAALIFDLGVVLADFVFILIAYFSTNSLLERLKDDPALFIFGGLVMLTFGIISMIKEKKNYKKTLSEEYIDDNIPKNNYLALFFKGFILNFINIGVLGFWMGVIIVFGPKLNMEPNRIFTFFIAIIITYFLVDLLKMLIAKQLKNKLTPYLIYRIKHIISIILIIFGVFLVAQGFFPKEKEMIEEKIEQYKRN